MWSSQGPILGLLLCIIFINDALLGMKKDSRPALFANDTSVLVTTNNLTKLQTKSTFILNYRVNVLH